MERKGKKQAKTLALALQPTQKLVHPSGPCLVRRSMIRDGNRTAPVTPCMTVDAQTLREAKAGVGWSEWQQHTLDRQR